MRTAIVAAVLSIIIAGSVPAQPGRFAYALHFRGANESLVKFDIDSDSILDHVPLPFDSGYNNFAVDEAGGCYISQYRNSYDYSSSIHYLLPASHKFRRFVDLRPVYGPHTLILTKDLLIAKVYGTQALPSHVKGGIVFIDIHSGKLVNKFFLQANNNAIYKAEIMDMFFDGAKDLFLTTFYWQTDPFQLGFGDIFVVDARKKEMIGSIEVPREYKILYGVARSGDKLYVTCGKKGNSPATDKNPINDELLVFSLAKKALVKKIKIAPFAYKLVLDPSVSKLYIQHRNEAVPHEDIEVMDVRTDRLIGKIRLPNSRMLSLVKPGKIYASFGGYQSDMGLAVIDTQSDRIIKRFNGDYRGISEKSYLD